jgi:adenylylsulfate kinase
MKILILGLPGSGKTYLAQRLQPLIQSAWYNADKVREMAGDWDFSNEGRLRQSERMKTFADFESFKGRKVICDFVCPTEETRKMFEADVLIWMNTIEEGRFEDTNKIFVKPTQFDFEVTEWNDKTQIEIAHELNTK